MAVFGRSILVALVCVGFASEAVARCTVDVSNYVGWQIIYSGTVTGYYDDSGLQEDDFEGCEHGRVLVIDYNSAVTCAEYSYSYAYRPDIVILSNGSRMKACIDDEMYDVRNGG